MIKGNQSIRNLHELLIRNYTNLEIKFIGEINDFTDSIGWKMLNSPKYLFSVSTLAGRLALNVFDLEISISDCSIENGEIVYDNSIQLEKILTITKEVMNGKISQ